MKKNKAFTLIEIIAVMSIILVLIGLISPALTNARQQAKINKARAMIGSIEVALGMYYTDQGAYPATGNLSILTQVTNNYGPYMEAGTSFNDPWGNPYIYTQADQHIHSWGPDEDEDDGDPDDIKSW